MLGQCHFSKKELHKKSQNDIQDMLMTQKGINFNDMPVAFKRGVTCCKNEDRKWALDYEPPIFSKQREYIEKTFIISKISESVEGE
jgi:tRNA(His) 5'-end guanylyltransferase